MLPLPPLVQALALQHKNSVIEVACNLLDTTVTSEEAVRERVQQLAAHAGLEVGAAYCTNWSPEELAGEAERMLGTNDGLRV